MYHVCHAISAPLSSTYSKYRYIAYGRTNTPQPGRQQEAHMVYLYVPLGNVCSTYRAYVMVGHVVVNITLDLLCRRLQGWSEQAICIRSESLFAYGHQQHRHSHPGIPPPPSRIPQPWPTEGTWRFLFFFSILLLPLLWWLLLKNSLQFLNFACSRSFCLFEGCNISAEVVVGKLAHFLPESNDFLFFLEHH